jgi:ABC-2 type transport system permease protein
MKTGILTLDLSFRRKSLILYSVGMALYVLVVVALYPSFKDAGNLDQFTTESQGLAALFGISGSLTTPTGWLSANIYANFFPLIVLMLTIGYGAWCLAGQEGDGHLELVLSLPFARTSVVAQKMATLAVQAVVFSVVVFLCSLVGRGFDLTVDTANLATTTLAVTLMGIDFGLLAVALGAASGNKGSAVGITAAIAAASYLISSMAPLIEWLQPLRYVSLFYWSVGDGQLEQGVSWAAFAVLITTGLALGAACLVAFRRHDLS